MLLRIISKLRNSLLVMNYRLLGIFIGFWGLKCSSYEAKTNSGKIYLTKVYTFIVPGGNIFLKCKSLIFIWIKTKWAKFISRNWKKWSCTLIHLVTIQNLCDSEKVFLFLKCIACEATILCLIFVLGMFLPAMFKLKNLKYDNLFFKKPSWRHRGLTDKQIYFSKAYTIPWHHGILNYNFMNICWTWGGGDGRCLGIPVVWKKYTDNGSIILCL